MRVRRIGLVALLLLALGASSAGAAGKQKAKAKGFRPQSKKAAAAKFARVERFQTSGGLGKTRSKVTRQLKKPAADKATAVAAIVRIMDTTYMRVGSEKYAKRAKPSFGASSLRKDQVRVRGDKVSFEFMGKSGVHWQRTVRDRELAGAIKLFLKSPGKRLFQLESGAVTETDVRDFLRPFGALPKDFRTLHSNRLLDIELRRPGGPPSKARLSAAIAAVAAQLGHSPAISRSSYLNPVKLETYLLRTK